jgi:hypothetical protein
VIGSGIQCALEFAKLNESRIPDKLLGIFNSWPRLNATSHIRGMQGLPDLTGKRILPTAPRINSLVLLSITHSHLNYFFKEKHIFHHSH